MSTYVTSIQLNTYSNVLYVFRILIKPQKLFFLLHCMLWSFLFSSFSCALNSKHLRLTWTNSICEPVNCYRTTSLSCEDTVWIGFNDITTYGTFKWINSNISLDINTVNIYGPTFNFTSDVCGKISLAGTVSKTSNNYGLDQSLSFHLFHCQYHLCKYFTTIFVITKNQIVCLAGGCSNTASQMNDVPLCSASTSTWNF